MRYTITGANRQTGQDARVTLAAASVEEAERIATKQGILVASVTPAPGGNARDEDTGALPIWDDDPSHPAEPAAAATAAPATAGGNQPTAVRAPAIAAVYHVIHNPALYLLETAVNKHIQEGWEPVGGIQVNNWNNQTQFYQALVRRKGG